MKQNLIHNFQHLCNDFIIKNSLKSVLKVASDASQIYNFGFRGRWLSHPHIVIDLKLHLIITTTINITIVINIIIRPIVKALFGRVLGQAAFLILSGLKLVLQVYSFSDAFVCFCMLTSAYICMCFLCACFCVYVCVRLCVCVWI